MLAPQCVAVDNKDNIYVTDSDAGKVFVFNAEWEVPACDRHAEGRRGIV